MRWIAAIGHGSCPGRIIEGLARASSGQKPLRCWIQPYVTAEDPQVAQPGWQRIESSARLRQVLKMTRLRGTELIRHCIGRLLLRRRVKVRSNITVDLDDVLGQQVPYCLGAWWHVSTEHVIEATILPDYHDKVADWRACIANR